MLWRPDDRGTVSALRQVPGLSVDMSTDSCCNTERDASLLDVSDGSDAERDLTMSDYTMRIYLSDGTTRRMTVKAYGPNHARCKAEESLTRARFEVRYIDGLERV